MRSLSNAVEVLRWSESASSPGRAVELEYETLLQEALLHLWDKVDSDDVDDKPFAEHDTPIAVYRRVLLSPRMVRRLLWPRHAQMATTREFWRASVRTERFLIGLGTERATGWTADGRAFVPDAGSYIVQPALDEELVLDLLSPHARTLDLYGGEAPIDPPRPKPTHSETTRVTSRLLEAWSGICASDPTVSHCMKAWVRVIVAQSDASGRFWSGSNGQYIGRVMIVNAEVPNASIEDIVDALVHEAIHGFLYIYESIEPWVLGNTLYTSAGVIRSPWSGNPLPVRPYMQAAFIWYGLATFWAQHIGGGVFDRDRSRALLERALGGFRRGSLVDRLKPWHAKICPGLLESIEGVQHDVLSLLSA